MGTILSFSALFLSIYLVQLGSGSLGPLDALSGAVIGFSTEQIGLLGSAHFLGFFLGCYVTPRLIGDIGHARAFAAAAAIGAIGALLHPILEGPYVWALLRMLTGLAIAAAYTVVESWLHAKTGNENRGRVYGVFRVVDLLGALSAQCIIAVLEPASYAAYNLVAMFCCLCLLPLALSQRAAPHTPKAPRLRPIKAALLSPTAALGIIVAGVTGAGFRMVGPIYGVENAMNQVQIAIFLAAAILGGVAAQFPVGWIADKTDRRHVLLGLSILAAVSCLGIATLVEPGDIRGIYLGALIFGMTADLFDLRRLCQRLRRSGFRGGAQRGLDLLLFDRRHRQPLDLRLADRPGRAGGHVHLHGGGAPGTGGLHPLPHDPARRRRATHALPLPAAHLDAAGPHVQDRQRQEPGLNVGNRPS